LDWKRFFAKHSPLIILAVLCFVLAVSSSTFRSTGNLQNVGVRTCVVSIIAVGQLLVILTGGIDLSVGSIAALAGVVSCMALKADSPLGKLLNMDHGQPIGVAIAIALLIGALCGLVNGALVAYGRIAPFIVTLGSMMYLRGIVMLVSDRLPVYGLPQTINFLGGKGGWWIPVTITLSIAVVFAVLLNFTRFGRSLYAIGGNLRAARLSGISVDAQRLGAYTLCGALAGFAGMMQASRVGIGDPSAAQGMELDAIAACVIGGASLIGGEGGVVGAVVGGLIMNVLVNYCNLQGLRDEWQKVLVGMLVVGLVYYDTLRKRRANLLRE
jgi:ribose/xylose/arabinose/galactoside ABC-type transport system permease subunit